MHWFWWFLAGVAVVVFVAGMMPQRTRRAVVLVRDKLGSRRAEHTVDMSDAPAQEAVLVSTAASVPTNEEGDGDAVPAPPPGEAIHGHGQGVDPNVGGALVAAAARAVEPEAEPEPEPEVSALDLPLAPWDLPSTHALLDVAEDSAREVEHSTTLDLLTDPATGTLTD